MKIEPHTITIRDLVAGYRNDEEEGVVAYGGRLDVRPKYQNSGREVRPCFQNILNSDRAPRQTGLRHLRPTVICAAPAKSPRKAVI